MRLKLFNSLTRGKESFGMRKKKIGMYVCGITPYSVTHLGHSLTYAFFDVLKRYLAHLGHKVTYVQNLTDIDDDILKKAKEAKTNWRALAEMNAQQFFRDLRWLNIAQPDVYPRATDHIGEILDIIARLLKKGFAYEKNGSVYFEIKKYKPYGKLSRIPKDKMLAIANERGNNPKDPNKKDPLDFVLWQAKKRGEPSWPSPWGAGRPGWHIECSAMASKYLGDTIDIHGGGGDLIFPHHESEIAQSEIANGPDDSVGAGKPLVRFWMHVGMLRYKGKKMSKSLGNLVLIEDLKKKYSANAVRICLLSHHYRSAWEYSEKEMKQAERTAELFKKVWRLQSPLKDPFDIRKYEQAFYNAMNDDMNTSKALDAMESLAKEILKAGNKRNITDGKAFLNRASNIMGLLVDYR